MTVTQAAPPLLRHTRVFLASAAVGACLPSKTHHLPHSWRRSSDRDDKSERALLSDYELPIVVKMTQILASINTLGLEMNRQVIERAILIKEIFRLGFCMLKNGRSWSLFKELRMLHA